MKKGTLIIGAGHAGVQTAASLREAGYDEPVVLIGKENELPYHKPPLSKTFIKDAQAGPQLLRGENFYASNHIDFRPGLHVTRIDLASRRLEFAQAAPLAFDRLVLATGSRPRRLSVEGADLAGVVSLREIEDARLIRLKSDASADVVVLGGGFIGLEIAATLQAAGRNVTVIEAADRLLGRVVAQPIGEHVRQRFADLGVRILTGMTVSRLEGENGYVTAAITSAGERLPAQLVIVGVGVVPNVELAEQAGIAVANGVRVDGQMRSRVAEIFAVGDVASYRHWLTGQDVRLESVQNATDQARLAAQIIAGGSETYKAVPWFWSDIGDMKLQMVGLNTGADNHLVVGERQENSFSAYHFAGERLVAIESVNRPADHMLGRKMMAAGLFPDRNLVLQGNNAMKGLLAKAG
ncbi:NAD(P)/FAD-dependent oxidoreductase [Aquamicrobium segne]|uniref:NAD(P)/FAD-dependent oxidoreductase n=1 Tax=Aquamicrobium segne TaxID=469547 RepID=A0ABW0GYB0_9HYPH